MLDPNPHDDGQTMDAGLPNGTSLLEAQFTITRRLSAGGFGITYLAEDNVLGRTIVIKECFPDELCTRAGTKVIVRNSAKLKVFSSIVEMFMHEARSLAQLRHPNIVGVHRAFEENGTAYMALDLIDGHDLLDIIEEDADEKPTPARIEELLVELLAAIEIIHDHDLLHRDISPDNIIIEKTGTPVLIDFGAARAEASRKTRAISSMIVVKDGYSPQEFYVSGSVQKPCSDLYALAATFYHMITGSAPTNSQIRMAELVGRNPDPVEPLAGRFDGYSAGFLESVDKAMQVVPRNRVQTAREWRALITGDDALQLPPVRTGKGITDAQSTAASKLQPVSKDLERILTRIIEETNEDVKRQEPVAPKSAPSDVIVKAEKPKPDWVKEFNEESLAGDDEIDDIIEEPLDTPEPEVTFTKRVLRKSAPIESAEKNWAARVLEKNERQREQSQHAELADIALKNANAQVKFSSALLAKDDAGLDFSSYDGTKMIEPLLKYLVTGIVLGLVAFMLYPALI